MKKVMKWLAIAIVVGFAALLAIGFLLPDKPDSKTPPKVSGVPAGSAVQPAAQIANAPQVNYVPDQCLDKVCIGMSAGELVGMSWRKLDEITDNDTSSQQRELLEYDQKAHAEKCLSHQTAWGNKASEMCGLLSRSASNPRSYRYRLIQIPKALDYFANQNQPVCEFYEKERIRLIGYIKTESGDTIVTFQFDATGLLRVFEVSKAYEDQNAETNAAIQTKLLEKHPYAINSPELLRNQKSGEASWGGKVTIEQASGRAPMIWMTAKPADFDQANLEVCKKAKPVSVQ